jgi:hypothetical protein
MYTAQAHKRTYATHTHTHTYTTGRSGLNETRMVNLSNNTSTRARPVVAVYTRTDKKYKLRRYLGGKFTRRSCLVVAVSAD